MTSYERVSGWCSEQLKQKAKMHEVLRTVLDGLAKADEEGSTWAAVTGASGDALRRAIDPTDTKWAELVEKEGCKEAIERCYELLTKKHADPSWPMHGRAIDTSRVFGTCVDQPQLVRDRCARLLGELVEGCGEADAGELEAARLLARAVSLRSARRPSPRRRCAAPKRVETSTAARRGVRARGRWRSRGEGGGGGAVGCRQGDNGESQREAGWRDGGGAARTSGGRWASYGAAWRVVPGGMRD